MDESEIIEMFGGPGATALEILDDSSRQFASSTDELRVYFETLEQLLSKENEKEALNFKKSVQHLTEDQQLDQLEHSILPYWDQIFDFNLKSSIVITLFSMLEVYFEGIRKAVHWAKNTNVESEDERMSFLERTKEMLLKNIGQSIHSLDWNTIKQTYGIRNLLTHTQGRCFKPSPSPHISEKELDWKLSKFNKITPIIEETDGLSIQDGWIKIDPAFCKRTVQTVGEFGIDLGDIIRDDLTNRGS